MGCHDHVDYDAFGQVLLQNGGTNWYGYVTNDPLNLIDRYGLETEDSAGRGGIRTSDTNWRGIGTGLSQIAVGIIGV